MPWPLSKVVMGPTRAFCSPEAAGVIICQSARVGVCVRLSVLSGLCLQGAHAVVCKYLPYCFGASASKRIKYISTQPYILLTLVQSIHIYALCTLLFLTPENSETGSGSLRGGVWRGGEAEEPSLTWGMGPNGTKPHSLLLHVENGRRARGGGGEGGKKKKSGAMRRRE